MTVIVLDLLTVVALLAGVFFMFIGALGLWRLPDLYNRIHAASKCITLGISGMLLALIFHLAALPPQVVEEHAAGEVATGADPTIVGGITKAVLVILFQFVAAPVGAHMLARAAHLDRAPQWEGTRGDELAEDRPGTDAPRTPA